MLDNKSDSRPSLMSHAIENKMRIGKQPLRGVIKASKSMQKFGSNSNPQKDFDGMMAQFEQARVFESQSNNQLMQKKMMAR